jgi:PiT family inorganic phosphate transporter
MSTTMLAIIGVITLCAVFDYTNGFHDSANSVATIVATGVLKPRVAVAWAAAWNFIAFLVFGTAVANTVAKTVDESVIGLALIFAAVVGATLWNLASWHLGLPTSSSHALVGGLVGAGVMAGGWDAISRSSVEKVAVFMVVSPLVGLTLAALIMGVMRLVLRNRDEELVQRRFGKAQLASSALVSLGHGGNDAQKTMGVIAAVLIATNHLDGSGEIDVPLWVVLLAHTAIAAGTYAGGWRIVQTMGHRITELRPVSGFAAETSAAVALFASTQVGAPVSTTQTVAGSIGGAGLANRAEVDWRVFGRVASAWVITVPASAAIGALTYLATAKTPPLVAGVIIAVGFVGTMWLTVKSMRSSPGAADFEQRDDPLVDLREALGDDIEVEPSEVEAPEAEALEVEAPEIEAPEPETSEIETPDAATG